MLASELVTIITELINEHGDVLIGVQNMKTKVFGGVRGTGVIRDKKSKQDKIVLLQIEEMEENLLGEITNGN